jgi:hypothetical protein
MIFLGIYIISLLVGIIVVIRKKQRNIVDIAETMLLYLLIIAVGVSNLVGFTGHVFNSEQIAAQLGWVSNGFQKELGFVSLGIAIAGFLCARYKKEFWLAVIIILSTFYLGAAANHIYEMQLFNNFNPLNVFPMISDIIIPLSLIVFWVLMVKRKKEV